MLLRVQLGQNLTDFLGGGGGGGMLHPPPELNRLNSEWQICMIYCLQSWSHISETVSVVYVLESCSSGWLRSIQEVPVCTCLEELIILRPRWECPVGPLPHAVQSDWKMLDPVVWVHRLYPEDSLYQRCVSWEQVANCPADSESGGFSWILHFTFPRLLATAVARAEHRDRLWGSHNLLFSQYKR
jgi:hypothetical protein